MKWFLLVILFICKIAEWHPGVYGGRYATLAPEKIQKSTRYEPKVIDKTCLLRSDPGPCRGNIPMYYFRPSTMNCSTFNWGGCQGNGNRFDTVEECNLTCLTRPNHQPQRKKWCSLRFDYGYCFGAVNRWYYDIMWKVCKTTIYSGCGGNKNNFYSQAECEQTCRFANGGIGAAKKYRKDGIYKVLYVNHPDATTKRTLPPSSTRHIVQFDNRTKCSVGGVEVPCERTFKVETVG